jgi:hypothetical protein
MANLPHLGHRKLLYVDHTLKPEILKIRNKIKKYGDLLLVL